MVLRDTQVYAENILAIIARESTLGSVLFNVLINDIDSGIKCNPSKFEDDTKLSGAVNAPKGRDAMQRDHDNLCEPYEVQQGHQYKLRDDWIKSCPAEEDLEKLVDEKLDSWSVMGTWNNCVQLWHLKNKKDMGL
ncbi:rna-directed dna polymerase from mobile element jockey-like [Pitangus sulphuratus]|nr:rna-directed dna polymerase from mobile element jockey-like [Pitangus sulphuratus]